MQHDHSSEDMKRAVTAALECHRVCEETITYCLEQGGRYADVAHIKLLADCADICRMSADFMARGSEFHARVCGMCADICERCAAACAQFGDDEQMRRCAQACRQCAESCRRMAAMAV